MAPIPRPGKEDNRGIFILEKFTGLNTKAQRSAIGDQDLSWSMNMMPVGEGNMRSVYSNGTPIYTAPGGTFIIFYYCFNIVNTDYIAVFLADGTADQVNVNTLAVTHISATAGKFYNGNAIPAVAQFGNAGIVITGVTTGNSYWAWDGTLYNPGDASPTWLNGGTPTTMPSGLQGNAIEVYQSRVWVFLGPVCSFCAPSNGAQFGSGGAGTFKSTDSFLKKSFLAARQANGFLYTFGDSSINVISNVQTAGSPAVTTFNNSNVEPQVSTPWPLTVQSFGRALVFANPTGVYALFGGTAEKISDALDGVFETADFTGLAPSAAVATIFGIKCYVIVINSLDPITQSLKPILYCWDGKKWFPATQDLGVSLLATQEISSDIAALGTDDFTVVKLFSTPSATLSKLVRSKLWGGKSGYITTKQALRIYAQGFDAAGSGVDLTMEIDSESQFAITTLSLASIINFVNNSGGIIQFQNSGSGDIFFSGPALSVKGKDCQAYGLLLGMTISSFAPDFTLVSAALQYQDHTPYG